MAIENPQTYAEWYWKNSLDATLARAESYEKTLSPFIADALAGVEDIEGMPAYMKRIFDALKHPSDPDLDTPIIRFVADLGAGLGQRILGHEVKEFDYAMNHYLRNMRITDSVANQLMLRRKVTPEFWKERNLDAGYNETEMVLNYEAMKPYPTMPDIIAYARYHGDPRSPKELAWAKYDISPDDWDLWDWLSRQKLNTEQVLSLYTRDRFIEHDARTELMQLGWHGGDVDSVLDLAYNVPNPMLLVQGDLMQNKSRESIIKDISVGEIHPLYAERYLDAVLTKPATEDIIAYSLRQDPSLSQLEQELQRIGVHPNYTPVYKELAYQIPPVADIITMAVREAFSPSIAARFGQYEDLPPDFIEWAQKKGLTKEWAERYWAAHWSLPSPQQGFEMLHRGVIGQDDLHLLLRALDVMPFWRDKLIKIAYKPLTRVDVRRMYAYGILDESGIRKAYTDLGYDENNARLMTNFTIEYTKGAPKKLSTADAISAYKKHLIESGTLRSLLTDAGVESEDIEPIIRTARQRRQWADTEDNMEAIEYRFKRGRFTTEQATTELRNLGLSSTHIQSLIPQWTAKSVIEKDTLWTTAQTLTFMKSRLISIERAKQELTDLGYDTEHIDMYIKATPIQTD